MHDEPFYSSFTRDKLREYRDEFDVLPEPGSVRQAGAAPRITPNRSGLTDPIARLLQCLARSTQSHARLVKSRLTGY